MPGPAEDIVDRPYIMFLYIILYYLICLLPMGASRFRNRPESEGGRRRERVTYYNSIILCDRLWPATLDRFG